MSMSVDCFVILVPHALTKDNYTGNIKINDKKRMDIL